MRLVWKVLNLTRSHDNQMAILDYLQNSKIISKEYYKALIKHLNRDAMENILSYQRKKAFPL